MTDADRPAPGETEGAPADPAAPASLPLEPEAAHPPRIDDEPPWREARRRVALAWTRGGPGTRVAVALGGVVGAALLGAFLFGLWHVVVGGFVKGNWNAAGFGFALAGVTGVMLWIEASIARRVLPPAR